MPQLFTEKVKKIETQEIQKKTSLLRKRWNEEGASNDKENEKNKINLNIVENDIGDNALKPAMVKAANSGTGIGSDQHHSNQ